MAERSTHVKILGAIEPSAGSGSRSAGRRRYGVRVSVLVRRRQAPAETVAAASSAGRTHMSRGEFRDRYGADPADLDRVSVCWRALACRRSRVTPPDALSLWSGPPPQQMPRSMSTSRGTRLEPTRTAGTKAPSMFPPKSKGSSRACSDWTIAPRRRRTSCVALISPAASSRLEPPRP